MHRLRSRLVTYSFAALLITGFSLATPSAAAAAHRHDGFNDEYVFAATRGVNDMEGVHPALKVPLFPITIVLDVAALPFAVIAGFIG